MGIHYPTQLDAPSGSLKQAEDPLLAHNGGELALQWDWAGVWAWSIKAKPQHIDRA
jgi:hypothetical protein